MTTDSGRLDAEILNRLDAKYPERKSLLDHQSPFQLLIGVILSAQTTDAAVNRVTPELFRRWPSPAALARAGISEMEDLIHSLGFYHQKSRSIITAARVLTERFGGEVPRDMNDLLSIHGVGRKSANVIRVQVWNLPGIIVDTHFGRVCRRLGLTAETDPKKVEKEIAALVALEHQGKFSMTANFHGRQTCTARKPHCSSCVLTDLCPKIGID